MNTMLKLKDYMRFMEYKKSKTPSVGKNLEEGIKIYQTQGSNEVLHGLASQNKATGNELKAADILLSCLHEANKEFFFAWKGINKGVVVKPAHRDWARNVYPIQQVNLSSCLRNIGTRLYLGDGLSRPDIACRKWMNHVLNILQTSSILSKVLGVNILKGLHDWKAEFSREVVDKIASPILYSDLRIPCALYKFARGEAESDHPYTFYTNRALLIHFKTESNRKGVSGCPRAIAHSFSRWLSLLALPALEAWQLNPRSAVQRRTANGWFLNVIKKPVQHYGLFTVELDPESDTLVVTRQFQTPEEIKGGKDIEEE